MRSAESFEAEYERKTAAVEQSTDQFRTSLLRHIDKLIEEEEIYSHRYAASLLRELRAWVETES